MNRRTQTIKDIVQTRFLPNFFYSLEEAQAYFKQYACKGYPFFIYLVETQGDKPVYSVIDHDLYNCMGEDPEGDNMKVLAFG